MKIETLMCDLCDKEIIVENINEKTTKVYHFSGKINGEFSSHIHICESCQKLYNFPQLDILKKLNVR